MCLLFIIIFFFFLNTHPEKKDLKFADAKCDDAVLL